MADSLTDEESFMVVNGCREEISKEESEVCTLATL